MAIGSRFVDADTVTPVYSQMGIQLFRSFCPILGKPVRDPTSGYAAVNREALGI
jgi:hypothetical protein